MRARLRALLRGVRRYLAPCDARDMRASFGLRVSVPPFIARERRSLRA
jgi:hypothetical protein